ncbi:MAG: hypothetical protein NZM04_04385 [Methylacidiphilales bacterium]|nr:hypothetical protein [Candidatus Methylacidiphilales bacterium]MDW8349700.1 hypothetical protein [Verrucomicrobiae bacterium]
MKSLLKKIGVDRAILFSAGSKFWSLFIGPISLLLIATVLSPTEQGYYYTFWSLIAAQVFFELGIGNVLLLYAGHEKAKLQWEPTGTLTGDPAALSRLASLFRKAARFYFSILPFAFTVITLLGWTLFSNDNSGVSWKLPWILLVITTLGLFILNLLLNLIEGCGKVEEIAQARFFSTISMTLAMWTTLISGGKLYAAALANLASLGYLTLWLLYRYSRFLKQIFFEVVIHESLKWMKEIWPMQWRSALSFINGYLMFQLLNPIVFHFDSPSAAGRLGMSSNLLAAVSSVSLAWIYTKSPQMCEFVAQRKWKPLDRLFIRSLTQSTLVLLFLNFIVLLALVILQQIYPRLASRFLEPHHFSNLILASLANHFLISYATYLRAHKQEPLVSLTLLGAILIPITSVFMIQQHDLSAMLQAYAANCWLLGPVLGTWIFLRKRKQWHRAES